MLRKEFFSQRVLEDWNSLPREAVDTSSLAALKAVLDGVLKTLI